MAYIYFQYNEKSKQTTLNVLKCLLKQLAAKTSQVPEEVQSMHDACQQNKSSPDVLELQQVLFAVMKRLPRVFFVFDALDECDEDNRCRELLPLFHILGAKGASVFVTGRPYPRDMQESLSSKHVAQIQLEAHEEDLRSYIEQKIEDSIHAKHLIKRELREEIIRRLVDCCKGMYVVPIS